MLEPPYTKRARERGRSILLERNRLVQCQSIRFFLECLFSVPMDPPSGLVQCGASQG